MMYLRNPLKLSIKKPSLTTALKRRLFGLRHLAKDKFKGIVSKRGGGELPYITGICSSILYSEIRKKDKNSTCFVKLYFFTCPTGATLHIGPQVQQISERKKQTTKIEKFF